jgi:3-oxoacyl-[acyl-carrier-protein] synthase-3
MQSMQWFVYAPSVADQFIKTGMYKNILIIGSEKHSFGLDLSTRGRNFSVIFGDGAGAVVLLQPTQQPKQGILSTHLHSDGESAEMLAIYNPGTYANYWMEKSLASFDEAEIGALFMSTEMVDKFENFPYMDGPSVFKKAIIKFPEVVMEANHLQPSDIDVLIQHQANLHISQFIQQKLGSRDGQVYNNIQKYGNATAASVPIALCEAW